MKVGVLRWCREIAKVLSAGSSDARVRSQTDKPLRGSKKNGEKRYGKDSYPKEGTEGHRNLRWGSIRGNDKKNRKDVPPSSSGQIRTEVRHGWNFRKKGEGMTCTDS